MLELRNVRDLSSVLLRSKCFFVCLFLFERDGLDQQFYRGFYGLFVFFVFFKKKGPYILTIIIF